MRVRSLFFILLCATTSFAQSGNYFLSHFSPDEERFNIVCFDIIQDNRGVFYFATQAGILQFDGRNWDIIQTNSTIYSIARNEAGDIYAAGSRGFGKIIRNEKGLEEYQTLYEPKNAEYIFQIVTLPNKVYFLSDHNFFEYDPLTNKTVIQSANEQTGLFVSLNELYDKVYISTEEKGLFLADGKNIAPASLTLADSVAMIFSVRYQEQYLIGTDDNRIFLSQPNLKLQEIHLEDSVYATASVIVGASWVNSELIAIGTLRGGVMFVNPLTGTTSEIINYKTGLPDNEVFAIITDQNLNVWAAHAYGFTRISPYLPFKSFKYYPGLEGNLLCATTYQGRTYVGTSLGLYVLEKEEFYDEITYFVEVPVRTVSNSKAKASGKKQEPVEEEVESKDSQKGGFFRFLKRKKNTKGEDRKRDTPVQEDEFEEEDVAEVHTTYRREKRTKKIFRSAYYAYKKVKGIDAKITQLTHWKGRLIASGLGGAFEVDAKESAQITDYPIRFLFASANNNVVIIATHDDKLRQFSKNGAWRDEGLLESISGPVQYIFEEADQAIWFCGFDKIYRKSFDDETTAITALDINNPNFEKAVGVHINNQVIIATPSGFFFYDQNTKKLAKGDSVRKPVAYFANATNLWFRDKHNWYKAGSTGGQQNLQLLNLFNNLRFIDSDATNEALWVITGNNELFRFSNQQIPKNEIMYPLILKSIQNNDIITAKTYLKVDQDKSSIIVEVVKPDYIANKFVEYRYFLEGLHTDWSEWSTTNNVFKFPYLPSGEYTLKVESRDIFGRIFELSPVRLNVEPPYWKQTWFYAAEFSVFVFLVLLSFRLSYRFIFVSRILSLLSIIMFIEFIQTAAGEQFSTKSSPVIDFAIQVSVAFMILPVEGFLRRHFLQALARRNEHKLKKATEDPNGSSAKDEFEGGSGKITAAERSEII
jgi:hypothetical protein